MTIYAKCHTSLQYLMVGSSGGQITNYSTYSNKRHPKRAKNLCYSGDDWRNCNNDSLCYYSATSTVTVISLGLFPPFIKEKGN